MAGDRLRIETLGGLSIQCGGEAVENFASSKVKALLVYLACTGREHPREALAELLWDGRSQRQALANLRVVLSSLRKEVGTFVSINRGTAGINDESDVWLDAAELEKAVEAQQETEKTEELEDALDLYKGDFLAGFFVPEASGFEAWAAGERQRLHRLTVDGMQRLGRGHLRQAEYAAAVASATRLVRLDPLAEAGHRQLMEALARSGQRAEALAQYETCREILAEELGIEPKAETKELYEAIRQAQLEAEEAPTTVSPTVTPTLPDFLTGGGRETDVDTPFLGRQEALARLDEHLQAALAGKGRAIFVSGEAGVGKSALVREFARRATEEDEGLIVALGHCSTLAAGEGVYQAVRQILNQLCGDVEAAVTAGDLGSEQARRLWQLMPHTAHAILEQGPNLPDVFLNGISLVARLRSALPERAAWLARLEQIVEEAGATAGELERSAVQAQVAAVLRALARERPLLLILEDVHWADGSTINLLFQLRKGLGASPILFVATYRPEEVHAAAGEERPLLEKVLAECKRDFGNVVVDLDAIGRAEGRAFVERMVDARQNELGEPFRQALYQRTQGHALFTVELLRALRQRGDVERDEEGVWRVAGEIAWDELPAQIEGVLEERLARLPPEARRLLDVAAVEGESFTAQVVARALDVGEREVVRHLNNTIAGKHRLVKSLGTRRLERMRLSSFRFRHELFRKFLYDSLEEIRRSYLHEDVGLALEGLYEAESETPAGELAWHFTEAGVAEKGLHYSLQAGDRARLAYAPEEAADHYENALVFLREKKEHGPAARTLMKLGLTYQMALNHENARRAFEEGFAAWQRAERHMAHEQHPPAPHPLRVPYDYEPNTLDHTRRTNLLAGTITRQLFSGLIENPGGIEMAPDLAQRWELEDGGRTVIFHLRQDARWSNGHPLTAEDFALSWRRDLRRGRGEEFSSSLNDIKGAKSYARGEAPADALEVRVPDPHTLIVELERPAGQFLKLAHAPVPAHRVSRHGDAWAEPEHLVTNGPFRLVRWRPRQEMVFERNPHYHGRYPGNVERVEYTYVEEWPTAMALYENDDLDVLQLFAFSGSVQAYERSRRRHADDYVSAPWAQTTFLLFDLEREPFDDPRVRRALALAVDRRHLADVRLHGIFFPADGGYISPSIAGHTPDINLPHAPQRARALLAEAGYPGGEGFPAIVAYGPGSGPYAAIRDGLQAQWRRVLDLDIHLRPVEWGEPMDDAHLYFRGTVSSPDTDPAHSLHSLALGKGFYGRKKALDNVLKRATETVELQRRLDLCRRAERLLLQEVYVVPLLYGRAHYVLKPWVHGYRYPGMGTNWKELVIEPH